MPKFRKKPVVIEAEQWFPGKHIAGVENTYVLDPASPAYRIDPLHAIGVTHYPMGAIHTLEGVMFASPGDWIITGVQGEKYPCKPDIFAATYEAVED
jgi:hypothetical protein